MTILRSAAIALTLSCTLASGVVARQAPSDARFPPPLVVPPLVRLTEHVYVIPDREVTLVPNIGVVVGDRAVLVVDTGMGPRNGATVLREVERVAPGRRIYVTATHAHLEHISGLAAFPEGTVFITSRALQQDLDDSAERSVAGMSRLTPFIGDLLKGVTVRRADEVFDSERLLDLGGVRVRLAWYGPAHSRGDTIVVVEGDGVVFCGDIAPRARFLSFTNQSSSASWFRALDRLEAIGASRIVPSHGAVADLGTIVEQRAMLRRIQARVAALKAEGRSADDTAGLVETEFREAFPDWKAVVPNELPPMVRVLFDE